MPSLWSTGLQPPSLFPCTFSSPCPPGQLFTGFLISWRTSEEPTHSAPAGVPAHLCSAPLAQSFQLPPLNLLFQSYSHPLFDVIIGLEASVRCSLRPLCQTLVPLARLDDEVLLEGLLSSVSAEPTPSYSLTTHKPLPLTSSLLQSCNTTFRTEEKVSEQILHLCA